MSVGNLRIRNSWGLWQSIDFGVCGRVAGAFHSGTVSNMKPNRLGRGEQVGGNSHGEASRSERGGWKTDGPVWRKCIEHLAEAARLNRHASGEQIEMAKPDIHALWRKRAYLAESVVAAPAPTIGDAFVKAVITAGLLAEGEVEVVVTPQCIEECDRALAKDGDEEQCLKVLEPDLWALCQRAEELRSEFEARWDDRAGFCIVSAWAELRKSVGSVARYETMTRVGLRAKGELFQDLVEVVSDMDALSGLQNAYLRDFSHLSYRRIHGHDSPIPRHSIG